MTGGPWPTPQGHNRLTRKTTWVCQHSAKTSVASQAKKVEMLLTAMQNIRSRRKMHFFVHDAVAIVNTSTDPQLRQTLCSTSISCSTWSLDSALVLMCSNIAAQ